MTTVKICRGTVQCHPKVNKVIDFEPPDDPHLPLTSDAFTLSNEQAVLQGSFPPLNFLIHETFEDTDFKARGWYDGVPTITTDESHSGTSSMVWHWSLGDVTPQGVGGVSRRLFDETETVYLSFWIKHSASWVGSGDMFHPHEIYLLTNESSPWNQPAFTNLTCYIESNYREGGIRPFMNAQDGANIDQNNISVDLTGVTETRGACGCNGNKGWANANTDCYVRGTDYVNEKKIGAAAAQFGDAEWHFVEAYIALNSITTGIGNADGIFQYWVDGAIVINETDVLLRTGDHPTMKFNQLFFGPFMQSGASVDQSIWMDDLILQTSKPSTRASTEAFTVADTSAVEKVPDTGLVGVEAYTLDDMASVVANIESVTGTDAWTVSDSAVAINDSGDYRKANEPGGMTVLTERQFDALNEGWFFDFHNNPPETIETDVTAPQSPPNVIKFPWPAGKSGGGPNKNAGSEFWDQKKTVYLYLTWKMSSNWQGHGSGTNKVFFLKTANPIGSGNNTYLNIKGSGAGSLKLQVSGQGYPAGVPQFPPNVGNGYLNRGQWYEMEFLFTANTPGSSNGVLEVWIDGVKTHNYTSWEPLNSGEGPGFNGILVSIIWGGTGDTVINDMDMMFDHIYISGKN